MATKLRAIKVREAAEITPLTAAELERVAARVQADWGKSGFSVGTCSDQDLAKGLVEGDAEMVTFLPIFSAAIKAELGPHLTDDALADIFVRLTQQRYSGGS